MAEKQGLKQGEKILFGITIVFIISAVIGYVILIGAPAHRQTHVRESHPF